MTTAIFGDSLYYNLGVSSWTKGNNQAIELGGSLPAVNSGAENLFIFYEYGIADDGLTQNYWLGLTDENSEGDWAWSNGDPVTWMAINWFNGEPNGGTRENYLEVGTYIAGSRRTKEEFIEYTDERYRSVDRFNSDWFSAGGPRWNDMTNEGGRRNTAIAEIPLTLTANLPESIEEGTEFTVDINLTAGTTGSDLTQGSTIWYTYEITGVDGNGDPDVNYVTGSGQIDANGQFNDEDGQLGLQITIEKDWVLGDDLFRLTFYSADPSGTGSELGFTDAAAYRDAIQIDVDQTAGAGIVEGVAVADILSNPDPITGELGLRKKVKLKNRGKVSFRLYGSEDIDVNAIDFDSILFGGDPEALMADTPAVDAYFQGAQRKKGKKAGSYRAKVKDINDDGFDDIKIKVRRRDIVGVMEKGDNEIYAYALMGEESVLFSNTETVFF